jgi:hypothetical protein
MTLLVARQEKPYCLLKGRGHFPVTLYILFPLGQGSLSFSLSIYVYIYIICNIINISFIIIYISFIYDIYLLNIRNNRYELWQIITWVLLCKCSSFNDIFMMLVFLIINEYIMYFWKIQKKIKIKIMHE